MFFIFSDMKNGDGWMRCPICNSQIGHPRYSSETKLSELLHTHIVRRHSDTDRRGPRDPSYSSRRRSPGWGAPAGSPPRPGAIAGTARPPRIGVSGEYGRGSAAVGVPYHHPGVERPGHRLKSRVEKVGTGPSLGPVGDDLVGERFNARTFVFGARPREPPSAAAGSAREAASRSAGTGVSTPETPVRKKETN